jgi:hypothetical protein
MGEVRGMARAPQGSPTAGVSRAPRAASAVCVAVLCLILLPVPALAASEELPVYLRDRGPGVATSLVATYVQKGEFLVYPFYEYTFNSDQEYKPSELGYAGESDFRGTLEENETLLFLSYGLSDNVAFELESALYTTATLDKAPEDPSELPPTLHETGFGDTQAEVRWKWAKETEHRPEFWSYFEVVFPFQKSGSLIGTSDWELIQGFGVTKGSRYGTLTARVSASYSTSDNKVVLGEYDLEYLKKFTKLWSEALSLEGEEDEVALIVEAQLHFSSHVFMKINNGFGLTSKAPDIAPELGIVFAF